MRTPIGQRLLTTIPSALAALRANKGRSVLTTLGIIIGVAAVIAMLALGQAASASINGQLHGLGTNVLTITPGSAQTSGARTAAGSLASLQASDADAIARGVHGVSAASPVAMGNAQVIAGSQNWQTRIQAVRPAFFPMQDWHVAQGAVFTSLDDQSARNVALLGHTVAANLFPAGVSPVGQMVRIRNVPFTVAGVLATKGSSFGNDQDDLILVPFQTGQVRLFGSAAVAQIVVQVGDASQIPQASAETTQVLRQQHRLQPAQADDFGILNNNDIVAKVAGVTQAMTIFLGSVAAVSLVVGGIGIMNIMLVSVTERTREIGIRLAIGAQPGDVLAQFLVEAVVLSVLGGTIGILLGSGVAVGVAAVAGWGAPPLANAIALAFGFAAMIGIFFGIYPARKAAQLDPIVALRYE
jgi:putative ABC transport system permease protein